jgi:hypothetical protein
MKSNHEEHEEHKDKTVKITNKTLITGIFC